MTEIVEGQLFDPNWYSASQNRIPHLLGAAPGYFTDTNTQYVTVETVLSPFYKSVEQTEGYDSLGYADGSNFEGDFEHWTVASTHTKAQYTGYIAGFPEITKPNGMREVALHMWFFNASVLDDTLAIPLMAVKSIHRYSALRRSLAVDSDEMSMGDVDSSFEVNLRNVRSGEVHSRPARFEDIAHFIAMATKLEKPEQIYPPLSDVQPKSTPKKKRIGNRPYLDVETTLL